MKSEGKQQAMAAASEVLRNHGVNPHEPIPDEAYEEAAEVFYAELIARDDYQSLREALSEHDDSDVRSIFNECILEGAEESTTLREVVFEYARPFIQEARDA